MVIRVNTHREKKALEMIELGFSILGITLDDFKKFKEIIDENVSLRRQNETLVHQLAVAKGDEIDIKEEKSARNVYDYLSKKESVGNGY